MQTRHQYPCFASTGKSGRFQRFTYLGNLLQMVRRGPGPGGRPILGWLTGLGETGAAAVDAAIALPVRKFDSPTSVAHFVGMKKSGECGGADVVCWRERGAGADDVGGGELPIKLGKGGRAQCGVVGDVVMRKLRSVQQTISQNKIQRTGSQMFYVSAQATVFEVCRQQKL